MAKKSFGYWGIDVGQCALKAVRVEVQDGRPVATAYDYIEHPKLLSQPDADPDALTREALEKFLSRNPVGKDQIAIAIAGQSGLARFVKLPPVEEKKIPEIVKFEAKQQIPFPLDEVVWDFQKIAGGDAVGGFAMETEVGLFAMKRDVIARHLAQFVAVGAEVHLVQMAPLALCNFATYEVLKKGGPDAVEADGVPLAEGEEDDTPRGKRRCAVILDIGTDNSNLIITDGGKIIWQRPIPLGGNHFTRALTKEMKLTFAKAEHLKRNAAKSPDLAQILKALRPVLTEFVGEVQRSLGYFTNTHRDAHVAFMVGLGNAFKLPGLQKYLSDKLSLDVRKPSRLDRVSGDSVLNDPNFQENLLTYPIALGLALQGVGLARLTTNLLPNEIRTERLVRAKKPWAAAAAACLLLGSGMVGLGYSAQLAAVTDPGIKKAIDKASSVAGQAKNQESERTKKEGEVTATSAEVKTIISGNDERLNWVRLNEVLVAALPRHGPNGNLLDPDQVSYWSTPEGDRAFEKYRERMGEGIPLEKIFDDDQAQHLAQVNLEAIHCRWTDTPATFLDNADKYANEKFGLTIAADMKPDERVEGDEATKTRAKPKAPDGGTWVFELRGYTYHKDGTNFLRRCLLKNLQSLDKFCDLTQGDKKVGEIIPGGTDPVKGRTSRVFLLLTSKDENPQPGRNFKNISRSLIDSLVLPMAAGGAGAGMPAVPAAAGVPGAAPPWAPLWSRGPEGAGAMADGAAGSGGEMAGMPLPEMTGPAGGTGGPVPPAGGTGRLKPKPRYEFIVCFLWQEPSPTTAAAAK